MSIVEATAVEAATNLTSTAIIELVRYLKNAVESESNLQFLITDLTRLEGIVQDIRNQFEAQQKTLPQLLQNSLESMKNGLREVKDLIDRAERQRQRCLGSCLFCNPKLPAQITEWKTNRFNQLFQELDSALSRAALTAQILESAQPQTDILLQPVPDSGFVGSGIQAAQEKLQIWLNERNPHARLIGLYGMAGVGKTSLLQLIHNDCKKKVSSNFDFVIWHTASQNFNIQSLQDIIAESVGLNLKEISSIDTRKMKLYAFLKNKRFLLILDDLWRSIADLEQQVGVNFGHDNSSRVLISSRYKDVVETMAATEYCMMIKPLSPEEGWELFRRKAFRNGPAPNNNVEVTARHIAEECQGLPLALNTVAAALAPRKSAHDWRRALASMRKVDHSFPSNHPTIEAELYGKLKWSYIDLPSDSHRMCFLYCAAFPEDANIPVDTLVEMCTAESLDLQMGTTYYMDVGRNYINTLVDRCLIQYVDKEDCIRVHDVLRDMAIYVGQREEKCLFLSSQHLQLFPDEKQTRDRKRISLLDNEISNLPTTDLRCPNLESLVLAQNRWLKKIPETFFDNLMSLKVLDLSWTAIEALPASVEQLRQLQCLHLRNCMELKELPDSICNLSHLQFLNLEDCRRLKYLPDRIGELKHLKHLNLRSFGGEIRVNPHQICQLTSLNRLVLSYPSTPMSLEDLSSLSNLIELEVSVKPEIKGGSMSSWSEMRQLTLLFSYDDDADDVFSEDDANVDDDDDADADDADADDDAEDDDDDAAEDDDADAVFDLRFIFGEDDAEDDDDADADDVFSEDDAVDALDDQNMQSMQELQYLCLWYYRGVSLPNCISNFQNLKELYLYHCTNLKELPGSDAASDGFPVLERLMLERLESLESIVWNEKSMLKLRYLTIVSCHLLKTFRTEELPNLRKLNIMWCDELSDVSQIGSLPMLETLDLDGLKKLESIAHWRVLRNLQELKITGCPVLKTFRTEGEELPNLRHLRLLKCDELSDVSQIGSLPMLETLDLQYLEKLESIAHWNDKTMPNLQKLYIGDCPLLRRLLMGLDRLSKLREIRLRGKLDWWEEIIWENDSVKGKFFQHFEPDG